MKRNPVKPEAELLRLIRGSVDFSLTISRLQGVWMVKLTNVATSEARETMGMNFDAAWRAARRGPDAPFKVIEGGKNTNL